MSPKMLIHKIQDSLTIKIFFVTAFILMVACLATYQFLMWATPISYDNIVGEIEYERALRLAEELSNATITESWGIVDRFILENGAEIVILDDLGNEVDIRSGSLALHAQGDVYVTVTDVAAETDANATWPNSSLDVGVSTQFFFTDSDEIYHLVVMSTFAPINHTAEAMRGVLPLLIALILLISFFGALFYSRYITRPIVRLSELSQKMIGLDFSCFYDEARTDEIGILGRNLDELSDNLSHTLEQLRSANAKLQKDIDSERELKRQRTEFFTSVSHELKTPLTILLGQITGMLDGVGVFRDREKYLPRTLAVVKRMEKLVEELLVISKMDKSDDIEKNECISLSELVEKQIEYILDLVVLKSQILETDIAPDIQIYGDKGLLQRAIFNLLSNATNHSPIAAKISVYLEGKKLVITNTGIHIPQDDLPHIFAPLYRVDTSRNSKTGGSGMGLYLAKMVFDKHGATCSITNTTDGVEAVVEFQ